MADAKLTALPAASALAGADLFYISQGGVSKRATHTQMLTLVGTTYVPLAGGTMTGALLAANGTKTAPSLSFSSDSTVGFFYRAANYLMLGAGGKEIVQFGSDGFINTSLIGFSTNTANDFSSSAATTYLGADGTSGAVAFVGVTLTNPQTVRIYGTKSSGSIYERLALSFSKTVGANITVETLGATADLDLTLTPAGAGKIKFGTHSALAAETVSGYITIKDAGGTTRKLAVVS